MTFFEKELHRLFDDSEYISADAVFAGKTMIAPIGEDLRVKVQFVNTNTHAKYFACMPTQGQQTIHNAQMRDEDESYHLQA